MTDYRAEFDAEVTFLNGGGLQAQGFRLDIPGPDVSEPELAEIAHARGETMAQLALAWVLENPAITSVITGASKLEQIRKTCRPFSALCRWQKKSVRLSVLF